MTPLLRKSSEDSERDINRLEDLEVESVHLVDRPAVNRKFLVVKRNNDTPQTLKEIRRELRSLLAGAKEARESIKETADPIQTGELTSVLVSKKQQRTASFGAQNTAKRASWDREIPSVLLSTETHAIQKGERGGLSGMTARVEVEVYSDDASLWMGELVQNGVLSETTRVAAVEAFKRSGWDYGHLGVGLDDLSGDMVAERTDAELVGAGLTRKQLKELRKAVDVSDAATIGAMPARWGITLEEWRAARRGSSPDERARHAVFAGE